MPRFSDYHRTVVGYHGTQRSVAQRIVLRQENFTWYDREGDWMGNGVYFWEYGPKQAWWWAEQRRKKRKWDEPVAVVASMIRLGFCFDLLDPDNARDLKSFHDDYVEVQNALGVPIPKNHRRHKKLDKVVFEYAYASIEAENERNGEKARVDTCRGVYVHPNSGGRLWKASWVEHGTFIQLLVRNMDCILGSWLVEPDEENDDGEKPAGDTGVDPNPAGSQSVPQDDNQGAGPTHAESRSNQQGAG